jgi:hypothetical protein
MLQINLLKPEDVARYRVEAKRVRDRLAGKKWREANPEKRKQIARDWARAARATPEGRETAKARQRAWYEHNGRAYYEKHKERHARQVRSAELKRQYGLTPADYATMLARQGNCCAICTRPFGQTTGDTHVDHCHTTGRVRGLLCRRCNRGLGFFLDSPDALVRAAAYVKRGGS